MYFYFPSCNFTKASPESSGKIWQYLAEKHGMQIAGCCRPSHKRLTEEDTAVTICQSCSVICRENAPQAREISIFEFLNGDPDFPWPDFHGERITIQDCWRARSKRSLQKAVRDILKKMNIQAVELEQNYDRTEYCGVFRFNPMQEGNRKIAPHYFIDTMESCLELLTKEEQQQRLEKHCGQYTTDRVVCYCNSCLRGVLQAGADGVHLLDLMLADI